MTLFFLLHPTNWLVKSYEHNKAENMALLKKKEKRKKEEEELLILTALGFLDPKNKPKK